MKRTSGRFASMLFVLSFVSAAVAMLAVAPPVQAGATTVTYDLGAFGAGTFFEGGVFRSWIAQGSVPAGSILRSVSINATIESTDNSNWASELMVAVDPSPDSPGGDSLLEIGPDPAMEGGLLTFGAAQNAFWANGYAFPVCTVKDTKVAGVDWTGDIDLATAGVFLVNSYGGPVVGGVWSGTVKITYSAAAAALTWTGGTSQWSTNPVTNWKDAGSNPVAFSEGDQVTFDDSVGAGSKTVNISGAAVSPSSVTFNNTLAGAGTYTLTGAAIAGDAVLTKLGDDTLIVQNANTYSGRTIITDGTVQISADNALPHGAGKDIVTLNGKLDLHGYSAVVNGLSGTGTVTNGVAGWVTLVVGDGDADSSFAGVIEDGSGTVLMEKWGIGTLTLTGANSTYTGKTVIRGGTLAAAAPTLNAGSPSALGQPTGADAVIDLYNGVTFVCDQGGSAFHQAGFASDRTLNLAEDGPGTVSIKVNGNDTIFTFGAVTTTGTGAKSLALFTGCQSNGDREAMIFNGPISQGADPLSLIVNFTTQKGSYSYVSLNGGGNFTGPITLVKGPNVMFAYLTIGGVLTHGESTAGSGQLGGGNYAGNISIDTGITVNYYSSADQILSGEISGAGNLAMSGSGKLTVSNANTYTGKTTISNGKVSINSIKDVGGPASALGQPLLANATIAIGSSTEGKLIYTGSGDSTDREIDLTGSATIDQSGAGLLKFTSNFNATGGGAKTLTLQGSTAGSGEIRGAIIDNNSSNPTSLVKSGTGTWILSGINTYTGTTVVNDGKLLVNEPGVLAWPGPVVVSGGTLGGNGHISSPVAVSAGGKLAPGAGVGTLYTGQVTMAATSVYEWEMSVSAADKVEMTGDLVLDSAWRLKLVNAGGTPSPTTEYTLFTYTGEYGGNATFGSGSIDVGDTGWTITGATIYAGGGRVYVKGISSVLLGDTNGDMVVDAADYITLKRHMGQSTCAGASAGDFDGDGQVTWADIQTLITNFGSHLGAPATTPEPATFGLLALGILAVVRRRRA